jgi:hypothetical protein
MLQLAILRLLNSVASIQIVWWILVNYPEIRGNEDQNMDTTQLTDYHLCPSSIYTLIFWISLLRCGCNGSRRDVS